MSLNSVSIAALESLEDVKRSIRDLAAWTDEFLSDDAPSTTPQVLARGTDGLVRQYTLVNGGGCTITINEVNHTITISVP